MSGPGDFSEHFLALLDLACTGELTIAQQAELEALVERDPDARRALVDHVAIHTQIRLWRKGERSLSASLARIDARETTRNDECGMMKDELSPPPIATGIHPSSFILHHLPALGSLTLSYATAALMLGVAVLAASTWKSPQGPLGQAAAATATIEVVKNVRTPVGRITRMEDCHWTNVRTAARAARARTTNDVLTVALGSKYEISAGLMEITYFTGAKVVLEGPVVYEVDGPNGGFLRRGRATFLCRNGAAPASGPAGGPAIAKGTKTNGRFSPDELRAFRVHVPRSGSSELSLLSLQDVEIALLVNEKGLFTQALSPLRMAIAPAVPMKKVVLPDYPSVVVRVGRDNKPIIVTIKRPPADLNQAPSAAATAATSNTEKEKTNTN